MFRQGRIPRAFLVSCLTIKEFSTKGDWRNKSERVIDFSNFTQDSSFRRYALILLERNSDGIFLFVSF